MSTVPTKPLPFHPIHPINQVSALFPQQTVTYSFWVPEFVIHATRALIHDTDFASLGVSVADANGSQVAQYGPTTVALGDLDNGTHPLNMHVAGLSVPTGGSIAVAFTILNHGSSKLVNDIDSALNEFGGTILKALTTGGMKGSGSSSAGVGILGLSSWEAALVEFGGPYVLKGIEDLLEDCDGIVVGASMAISESQLAAQAGPSPWVWSTEYKGTSPGGVCGASDYTVSYSVMASPPCVTVPSLFRMSPEKVAGALSAVGLTGKQTGSSKGNVDEPEVSSSQSPSAGMIVMPGTVVEYAVEVPEGGTHERP